MSVTACCSCDASSQPTRPPVTPRAGHASRRPASPPWPRFDRMGGIDVLNRKWLNQGIGVAIGVFLAAAVVVPLISDQTFGAGLRRGIVAASAVVVIYIVIAAVKKEPRDV